jgi:hypothetical protein
MASTYLTKSMSGNTASTKMTFSAWVKLSSVATGFTARFFGTRQANHFYLFDNNIYFDLSNTSGTNIGSINTTRVFRDTSAWYHIVAVLDTTLSTATDRQKIYINGERATTTVTAQVSQNATTDFGANGVEYSVGARTASQGTAGGYFDGSMAHAHYTDGYAYDADTFGETDSTTGIWKPKTNPSVTYGTNGFFLKFENSSAFGTDSSGNGNNFTVNGTMTQTLDTPSNVFATANATMGNLTATFSNGNLTVASTGGGNFGGASTLGVSSGKYYAEFKITAQSAACGHLGIDGDPQESARNDHFAGENAWSYGYNASGQKYNNNTGSSYGDSFTLNDILMIAMDLDNNYVYFGKNGTWQNSGDPTSGATGTGAAYSISSSPPSGAYFFVSGDGSGSNSATIAHNYGNGYFGTTAVSSAQNPDDGIGIFEYDVPTGYRALCTKSINAEEYD